MMMSKISRLTALLLSIICVFSLSLNADDGFETNKFTAVQKFYYNLGVEKTKKEYYEKGYSRATQDFSKLLSRYEQRIKELEAGKYLINESKITYPQVYKTKTSDGGYQIHIEAPTVEKEFSTDDLFLVPLRERNVNMVMYDRPKIKYPDNRKDEAFEDSFTIPSMLQDDEIPTKPEDLTNKVYVDIKFKSSNIKKFLDTYNAKYSTSENGYKVEFNNESQKRDFCIKLTGEATCYDLN